MVRIAEKVVDYLLIIQWHTEIKDDFMSKNWKITNSLIWIFALKPNLKQVKWFEYLNHSGQKKTKMSHWEFLVLFRKFKEVELILASAIKNSN